MTESWLMKYSFETKHTADRVTAALKEDSCCLSHRQQCFLKTAGCLNE
jgi:hypothetical protein